MNSQNYNQGNQYFNPPTQNQDQNQQERGVYDDFSGGFVNEYGGQDTGYTYTEPPCKKPKKKLKKFIVGGVIAVLSIILVFLIICWVMTLSVPDKTNFLIMATDEDGTRTDTLMLGTFDKSSKDITLISIPRDTYVTVTDENYDIMNREYPQPGSKSMKINTVHHFAGAKHGVSAVIQEVELLTGVNIDFYVKVDFDAFRYIIDSIGGIEFDVPQDMYYVDPYQNLEINLKKGVQRLNGEQAEHLLRYRSGYANADLGRISVQQDFMKAFIGQTLSKGTILSNPGVYLKAFFKYDYVETNANLFDIASYAMIIGGINSENIQTHTLPGYAGMAGGQSVYNPDITAIDNLINETVNN